VPNSRDLLSHAGYGRSEEREILAGSTYSILNGSSGASYRSISLVYARRWYAGATAQ